MRSYAQYCGLALALDHVGERWTLLIVRELLLGPRRFTDLAAALRGAASNLLTERLKTMEENGLVTRRALTRPSTTMVYELTKTGQDLREAVDALVRWGGRFMPRREPDQVFRPEWLCISLGALCPSPRLGAKSVTFEIVTPEGAVRLTLSRDGVRVADPGHAPEVTVHAPVAAVLGVASRVMPGTSALRFTGPRLEVRTVREWLSGGVSASAPRRRQSKT